jgi:hypothetical protein
VGGLFFRAEDILDLLESRTAHGLISTETFAHIKALGPLLPDGITYGLGFETRLTDPSGDVDLILRPLAPGGLQIIAGLETRQSFPGFFVEDRNWQSLRDLCSDWAIPGSQLHNHIFCLWIEIDSEQLKQAAPSPSLVFVQLQRTSSHPELYEPAAQAMHMSLKGCALPPAITENLVRCIKLMPEKALMTLFGLAIARPSDAFRVVVGEVEPDQIPDYVSSAGWKGNSKFLESVIFSLIGYADRHSINFDLDEHGIGKIGIEFGIPQEHLATSDPRWPSLLDFLVSQGWCRPEKRDALLAWPKNLALSNHPKPILLRRFISHVKLGFEAGRRVTAKAYVGLVW